MAPTAQHGIDIMILPHKKQRTYRQNQFLAAILQNIIRFYQVSGFAVDGLPQWAMSDMVLREYFKQKFGVASTAKLSTAEFGQYCDQIQQLMIKQSRGNYTPIIPDDAALAAWEKEQKEQLC
jgi:hypothetical protein